MIELTAEQIEAIKNAQIVVEQTAKKLHESARVKSDFEVLSGMIGELRKEVAELRGIINTMSEREIK